MRSPRAIENRNPLNVRYSVLNNWKGQVGEKKGFCVFESFETGWRAAAVLVCNYIRKGYDTVPKIICRWAPESENDTKAYIRTVCGYLTSCPVSAFVGDGLGDISVQKVDSYDKVFQLIHAMMLVEVGVEWLRQNKRYSDTLLHSCLSAQSGYTYPNIKK